MDFKSAILSLSLLSLAACGVNGEQDFLCGAETGQPCQTLSDVDGTSTERGTSVQERAEDTQANTLSQNPLISTKGLGGANLSLPDGGTPYVSSQYRIPEKTGTLWIAPRKDEGDLLHEATFVHFVIWDARWGRL